MTAMETLLRDIEVFISPWLLLSSQIVNKQKSRLKNDKSEAFKI